MTNCTTQTLLFASLDRRQVVADFKGGDLTSNAGLLLLREVDRKIGLLDALNDVIFDPRNQRFVVHDQRTMLAQRVLGIAAAYEDLNDHNTLRRDTLLQTATERRLKLSQEEGDPLASPYDPKTRPDLSATLAGQILGATDGMIPKLERTYGPCL